MLGLRHSAQKGFNAPMVRGLLAAWLAAALVMTGCSDEGSVTAPTTSTTSVEDAVLAAYRAHWDAWDAAKDPPNPDHPRLAATHAGAELRAVKRLLRSDLRAGTVRRGKAELHPTVARVDGDVAVVHDCYIARAGIYVAESGQVVTEPTAETIGAEFTLRRYAGSWKVVERELRGNLCRG